MRRSACQPFFPGRFSLLFLWLVVCLRSSAQPEAQAGHQSPSAANGIADSCRSAARSPAELSAVRTLDSDRTAAAYKTVGTLFGQAGNFACSVAAFQSAYSLDPGDPTIQLELGVALLENHQPGPAAEQLQSVVRARPDSFLAHNALGLAFQDLNRPTDSEAQFQSALAINPRFPLAAYDLGQLLGSEKRYRASVYYLQQALSSSPSGGLAVQVEVALAAGYAGLGDYGSAVPLLEKAVGEQPGSPAFHFDLGTAYAHLERYPQAVDEYETVLCLDPRESAAELWLAKTLLNQSRVEESLPYL